VNATLERPPGHVIASNQSGPIIILGESAGPQFDTQFTVSSPIEAGNFTLNVTVTDIGGQRCHSEAYNVTLWPLPSYNCTWTTALREQIIGPGETAYYNLTLTNVGTGSATFSIGFANNDSNWRVLLTGPLWGYLGPGASLNTSVSIQPWVPLASGAKAYTNVSAAPGGHTEYTSILLLVTTYSA